MGQRNPFGIEDGGKTAGLLSYFFVLGWSMSYFAFHKTEKTSLSSYQLRQTLFLYIGYVVIRYGLSLFSGAIGLSNGMFSSLYFIVLVNLSFVVLWIIGLAGAINGEQKPIPFFGEQAQIVFARL